MGRRHMLKSIFVILLFFLFELIYFSFSVNIRFGLASADDYFDFDELNDEHRKWLFVRITVFFFLDKNNEMK